MLSRYRPAGAYSLLSRHYMGVSGQRHAPAALYPLARTPGTHWIGGWVDLRPGGLDTEAKKIPLSLPGIETRLSSL